MQKLYALFVMFIFSVAFCEAQNVEDDFQDNLTIKLPNSALGTKVTLVSLLGQKIHSYIQHKTSKQLNLANYKTGMYIVKIESDNEMFTYKIIKK